MTIEVSMTRGPCKEHITGILHTLPSNTLSRKMRYHHFHFIDEDMKFKKFECKRKEIWVFDPRELSYKPCAAYTKTSTLFKTLILGLSMTVPETYNLTSITKFYSKITRINIALKYHNLGDFASFFECFYLMAFLHMNLKGECLFFDLWCFSKLTSTPPLPANTNNVIYQALQ